MKYIVTVAGRAIPVEVGAGRGDDAREAGGPQTRVVVEGETLEARLVRVPAAPLYRIVLGERAWTFAVEPAGDAGGAGTDAWILSAAGERLLVRVADERARALDAAGSPAAAAGETVIAAPMPGLVVRVAVVEGQRVDAGGGVVVVEAMKMQNELRAGRAGVVARVHVAPGEKVEKGAPLVTLTHV